MEMAQLIHPPPPSSGEALLLGAPCLAGCWLWRASQGSCSLSSLLHLLAPAGLSPRSAAVFGDEFLLQSLGSVTCSSPTAPSMWLLGHGNGNRQTDVRSPGTDICGSATVGGEGCSSQPLPPVWFHWGKWCVEPLCSHRAAQVCGVRILS